MVSAESDNESFSGVARSLDLALQETEQACDACLLPVASNGLQQAETLFRQLVSLADTSNHVQVRILHNRLTDLARLSQRVNGGETQQNTSQPARRESGGPPRDSTNAPARRATTERPARGPASRPRRATPTHTGESVQPPEQYQAVCDLIENGRPVVFVTGNAGTGKSTLIRYLSHTLKKRHAVAAPTGVAALNAGGVTIHSFFHLPPRIHDDSDIKPVNDPELYQRLELLIIDEVSMVRADLLDSVDRFLRRNRGNSKPFGGVQLLLVGDLFQLPPVVTAEERDVLQERGYVSPYFFSSLALQKTPLAALELTSFFRQQDPSFIELLNRIRTGDSVEPVVAEINRRCCRTDTTPTDITLTCTNYQADRINARELQRLPTTEWSVDGLVKGSFALDGDRLPSPKELRLKEGAHVMFTKNDEQRRWVNGSVGIVRQIEESKIRVELMGDSRGQVCEVQPTTWTAHRYRYDRAQDRIAAYEAGKYTQYPLMLAWAVTIHKSQGQSLDNVLIDLGQGAFASGQLYVALSRCRSIEGIRLARPLRESDVICDPEIGRFYAGLKDFKGQSV